MIELQEVKERIEQVVTAVGLLQQQNLGRSDLKIDRKSSSIDLVTEVDKQSERLLIDFVQGYYPSHAILAEESGTLGGPSDYLWVIDPLDGTTNYAQGLPIFSISVALQYKGETMVGVVYAPVVGQMFTAIRGQGAWLNGERLRVSAKTNLLECVLATGFPYDAATQAINNLTYFNALLVKARAIRRFGSAAYDLACTAAGRFDGYWEMKLSPWDVAAGLLLVEEAGGQVIHFREDRGVSVIAGNQAIAQKIQAELLQVDHGR